MGKAGVEHVVARRWFVCHLSLSCSTSCHFVQPATALGPGALRHGEEVGGRKEDHQNAKNPLGG